MKITPSTTQEQRSTQLFIEQLLKEGWECEESKSDISSIESLRAINEMGLITEIESVLARGWKVTMCDHNQMILFGSKIGFANAQPYLSQAIAQAEAEDIASYIKINSIQNVALPKTRSL